LKFLEASGLPPQNGLEVAAEVGWFVPANSPAQLRGPLLNTPGLPEQGKMGLELEAKEVP